MMSIYKSNANLRIANKRIRRIGNSPDSHKIRIALASRGGFTIIEMLVVVAIAGMLLSGVFVLFQGARAKGRDAVREQDIKTLQNALSLYVTNFRSYPVYDGYLTGDDAVSVALKNSDSLPQMLRDSLNSGNYRYSYTSADGSTYILKYYLETNSVPGKAAGLNQVSP